MARALLCAALAAVAQASEAEPNPPTWPSSVSVFGPEDSMSDIQQKVNDAYTKNGGREENGQFSSLRYSFLFKPGTYSVDVPVGYYTQVSGLGASPTDVVFSGSKGVYCEEASYSISPGALDTFWRAAENFQTDADFSWNQNGHKGMIWAASQASSLRRVVVTNDLDLFQYRQGENAAGFASGGYLGNTHVKGTVSSGSQQQFLARNCKVGKWSDGVWNIVTVGVEGSNPSHCSANSKMCTHPYTQVEAAPEIVEKPFISIDKSGKYQLNAPKLKKDLTTFDHSVSSLTAIDFSKVYVADAAKDTAASINKKLTSGLHVVLSPGIYELDAALELNKDNQILLGMGLATLVATTGEAVVKVGDVDGVRVAGIIAEAGPKKSASLVEWGTGKKHSFDASNPGALSDIFTRIGGPAKYTPAQAHATVVINSDNVIVDNTWFWRADHLEGGKLVYNGDNPCEVGGIMNGAGITAYGLKAEHCLTDQVQWNGEGGKTFMFQAEMPYDVNQANFGDKGYVGYRVADGVKTHQAYGLGIYHYFRDNAVTVESGISAPASLEKNFVAPLTVFLNGQGTIKHILNDKGDPTTKDPTAPSDAFPAWLCPAKLPLFFETAAGSCKVGDPVTCPGTGVGCAGNTCCPDGSTCPSASDEFGCCPLTKKEDCLKPGPSPTPSPPAPSPTPSPPAPSPTPSPPSPTPSPGKHCKVGDAVTCPGTAAGCAGDQCCPDGSTCPSAEETFSGCAKGKSEDCTKSFGGTFPEIFL